MVAEDDGGDSAVPLDFQQQPQHYVLGLLFFFLSKHEQEPRSCSLLWVSGKLVFI